LTRQLSGGRQRRVAVGRAIAGHPTILLADEPTGNLDSSNGEAVMSLLHDLHRSGSTICMVTHDPRFARHADRTIRLFDGRVVEMEREKVEVEAGSRRGEAGPYLADPQAEMSRETDPLEAPSGAERHSTPRKALIRSSSASSSRRKTRSRGADAT